MSFNQFQQHQPGVPLPGVPFPHDMLVQQIIPVNPGQPPVQPQVRYLPQQLAQAYPFIVSSAIDAVQAKATSSPLRAFMFNQMVQFGWNNPDFTAFVEGLIRLIEVKFMTRQIPDLPNAIANSAAYFAELTCASNTQKYPQLMQILSPDVQQGVMLVLQNLQITMQELDRYYGAQQQPMQQPMGMMVPGMMQPQQQFGGVPGRPLDFRQAHQQHSFANAGVPAVATSGFGGNLFSSAGTDNTPNNPAARFENAQRDGSGRRAPVRPPAFPPAHQPITNTQNAAAVPAVHSNATVQHVLTNRTPPPAPAPTDMIRADAPTAKWVPSEVASVNATYDPNTHDLYYHTVAPGVMKPVTSLKKLAADMDITKHLLTPSVADMAPPGLQTLDIKVRAMQTGQALNEERLAIADVKPIEGLNEVYKDKSWLCDTSIENMWLANEVELTQLRRLSGRTNVHRSCAVLLDALVCRRSPKAMINKIASAPSFEAAAKIMNDYQSLMVDGDVPDGDEKALGFINRRLTEHLNNFIKKVMALPLGWAESFMEDAPAITQFLSDKYGPKYGKILSEAQGEIITKSLMYVDSDFEDGQITNLVVEQEGVSMEDAVAKLKSQMDFTFFSDDITLTSLDLYSPELRFELPPNTEISVGVFGSQTPLLRQIADNIFTHARNLKGKFYRHLLRTADGVTLEFTISAMNPEFYLVCAEDL